MALDGDVPRRVPLQDHRVFIQCRLSSLVELAAVEREERRLERRVAIQVIERRRRNGIIRDRFGRHNRRLAHGLGGAGGRAGVLSAVNGGGGGKGRATGG